MIQVQIVTIMTQIFSLSSSAVNLHHFFIKEKNNSLEVKQRVLIIQTHNDEVLS